MLSYTRSHSRILVTVAVLLSSVAVSAQEAAPAPAPSTLVLSPAAFGGTTCYQGWASVLELTLWRESPRDAEAAPAEPLKLSAKEGTWREALVVAVKNDNGAAVQWPLHLIAREGAQLTLAEGATERVEWYLAPEETQALPEGSYSLSVSFDPKRVEGLPTGAAAPRADSCHLQVTKEPATLSADLTASKLYRQAWYLIVRGDKAGADGAIAGLLATDPQSIGARRLKALLAAREGRVQEGLALINQALAIYLEKHPKACPPAGLLSLRDQLTGQLAEQPAADNAD